MIDPVSTALEERARLRLPWKWALVGAVLLHLGAGFGLLIGGSHRPRALSLPSVQVRIAPGLPAPGAAAPAPVSAPAPRPASSAPAQAAAAPPAPPRKAVTVARTPARSSPTRKPATPAPDSSPHALAPEPSQDAPAAAGSGAAAGTGAAAGSPDGSGSGGSGGVALGSGSGTEESFPFAYYINRVLGSIESNWFKPPVPADTRCRIRCRIDRSGRIVEAGIAQASSVPAFDRAALRAVYASAPFPPLPLGFSGAYLTLNLEFGP